MKPLPSDRYYDVVARKYDAMLDADPLNRDNRREVEAEMRELLGAGARVLDFGGGTGSDWEWMLDAGFGVCCFEPSAGMREVAAQKTVAGSVSLVDDLAALQGGETASAFDGILANFAVLNHIVDLHAMFGLFGQLLRPGGQLLAVVLNPEREKAPECVEFEGQCTAVHVHSIVELSAASGPLDLVADRPLSGRRFRLLRFEKSRD